MQSALFHHYGPPSALELGEIPLPSPKAGELLVRVKAVTVNRTDCALMQAQPFVNRFVTGLFRPTNPTPGSDFAGEIVAVADSQSPYKVGDRIFGLNDAGLHSHAEYLCVKEKAAISLMPSNATFEEAVACLEGAHYAINFLNKVKIKAGDKVLVNGATGGIGSALVQLLVTTGANITAVCKKEHFPLVKALGAHVLIDYTSTDFTQTSGRYHFVFDSVGKSSFGRCKPLLLPGGIYISSELGAYSQNLFYALLTPLTALFPGKKRRVVFPIPTGIRQNVGYIKTQLEAGLFRAVIDKTYAFTDIRQAYEHAASGQKIGSVVVQITDYTRL